MEVEARDGLTMSPNTKKGGHNPSGPILEFTANTAILRQFLSQVSFLDSGPIFLYAARNGAQYLLSELIDPGVH